MFNKNIFGIKQTWNFLKNFFFDLARRLILSIKNISINSVMQDTMIKLSTVSVLCKKKRTITETNKVLIKC